MTLFQHDGDRLKTILRIITMQYLPLILVCLLLSWLALERRRGSFRPVYSLKLQTVWTVLMLLLAVSLSMYPRKQASELEQEVLGHWDHQLEMVMLITQV